MKIKGIRINEFVLVGFLALILWVVSGTTIIYAGPQPLGGPETIPDQGGGGGKGKGKDPQEMPKALLFRLYDIFDYSAGDQGYIPPADDDPTGDEHGNDVSDDGSDDPATVPQTPCGAMYDIECAYQGRHYIWSVRNWVEDALFSENPDSDLTDTIVGGAEGAADPMQEQEPVN